ncbi:MAG: SH3 domain-containing protein [Spirochaetales bacterium]|nr:SH3 domain-containing protein [Spirochaetales bacterium]
MIKYGKLVTGCLLLFFILASCGEDRTAQNISLPSTPIISSYSSWAVVKISYLRIRAKPTADSEMLSSTGLGAVVRIVSQTEHKELQGQEKDYWYQIEDQGIRGWVFGAYLEFFSSKSEAENHAKELQ